MKKLILMPLLAVLCWTTATAGVGRNAGAEAMGQTGRGLYVSAAGIMAARHSLKPHRSLTAREKNALRSRFGSLVDRVTITWGAAPLDKWGPLQIGNTIAQTYGYRIYIDEPYTAVWSRDTLELVTHEMVHSLQYARVGASLSNFGYHYFKNWALAKFSYRNNVMEQEAYRSAAAWIDGLWSAYNGHSAAE